MRSTIWMVLLGLVASGCAMRYSDEERSASVTRLPPPGMVIDLRQTLTLPAGQTRLFLQRGGVVTMRRLDHYQPFCNFELRTLSELEQTIEPEALKVVKVQEVTAQVVDGGAPVRLAGMDDGPPMIYRGVHLWFDSSGQPGLMRLTCRGALADMHEAELPSVDDIRAVLGQLAEVTLP